MGHADPSQNRTPIHLFFFLDASNYAREGTVPMQPSTGRSLTDLSIAERAV
jgi:hypothetical protein